ncbi:molecular chaperone DnaJ [Phytoactinopolyspora limicola]|uniref:molecular chaperone DnaJ n=1 Tax=Phytoactinopolyspora limicola TaxID=2715536 RepID=UPI001407B970|nr:molecular chaperone DnaJ [Phytoactinopolyspora limicola]
MDMRFRPITWTGPKTPIEDRRSRHTFKATWGDTLNLLNRELYYLDAERAVIEADFTKRDIRLDGMPRSHARQPVFPGVRLSFESRHGPLSYATDSCEYWQHNIRSIALGLEALRAVDRYGITRSAEQYRGWLAIEAAPGGVASVQDAFRVLSELAGWETPPDLADPSVVRVVYRIAVQRHHPDRGGDAASFHRVQAAAEFLREAGWQL